MNSLIAHYLKLIQKEVWSNRKLVVTIYFLVSMGFLFVAWVAPRIYTSTSIVLIESESILSPLMQNVAVTSQIVDESRRARQIILSKNSIDQVLKLDVWKSEPGAERTEQDLESLGYVIRANASVKNLRNNLIEISYSDSDPKKAFETASLFTSILVDGSLLAKQEKSRSAFDFIDNQVETYKQQLQAAEKAIKEFRSRNVESTPGAKAKATARLIELNEELDSAQLAISAEKASIELRRKQLTGEIKGSGSDIEQESLLSARIGELEKRLNDLLLNYMETYPDVVQLKNKIDTFKNQLAQEVEKRESNDNFEGNRKPTGTVAQELRREVILSENNIVALKSRVEQLTLRIEREKQTLAKIIAVEAEVAELTRDYTINQNQYDKLLGQRENARVTMNIDIQQQGSSMKIQEFASFPYIPKGIRFVHIILAGLILSFLVPAGVVFLLAELDQKVRSEQFFKDTFKVPVLASVYSVPSSKDIKNNRVKFAVMVATVLIVWIIYAYAIFLRIQG
jgi:polysaccharide chain length determinant protein (PEP-CTERM system associated)